MKEHLRSDMLYHIVIGEMSKDIVLHLCIYSILGGVVIQLSKALPGVIFPIVLVIKFDPGIYLFLYLERDQIVETQRTVFGQLLHYRRDFQDSGIIQLYRLSHGVIIAEKDMGGLVGQHNRIGV